MLPSELAFALNLCGVMWINVDEDKLSACAVTDRKLAAHVDVARTHTDTATTIVTTRNKGKTASAVSARGNKVSVHLGNLKKVYELAADALDWIAHAVKLAKIAVITQLGALAVEITAAAAASLFTLGLTDALDLAATAAAKMSLRQIFDMLERPVMKLAEMVAVGDAMGALMGSMASLAEQGTADYVGSRAGISVAAAARAGASAV